MEESPIPRDFPYVPDVLIIQERTRYWSMKKDQVLVDIGTVGYEHLIYKLPSSNFSRIPNIEFIPENWILVVGYEEISTFPLKNYDVWIANKASELLTLANSIEGDVEKKMSLLRACGNLIKIKIPEIVKDLESKRKTNDESLVDIFQRTKK